MKEKRSKNRAHLHEVHPGNANMAANGQNYGKYTRKDNCISRNK